MPVSENTDVNLMEVLKMAYTMQNYPNIASLATLPNLTVQTQDTYPGITEDCRKVKEEVMQSPAHGTTSSTSSSPRGSAGRADSPASTTGSLPKESEHAERKRPAAIQELLQSKKARLNKIKSEKPEASSERPSPALSSTDSAFCEMSDRKMNADDEDCETTSSGGSVNGNSAPASFTPTMPDTPESASLLLAVQQQRQLIEHHKALSLTPGYSSCASDKGVLEYSIDGDISLDKMFAQVPGRLSLLSNVVKYKMTVGEVRRRLMGPESFNFSLLGALLRRAKMPEKSQLLVQELSGVGLSIARGRRRMTSVTLLSALTECESVQLAKDFQQVTEKEFPVKMVADKAVKDHFTGQVGSLSDYAKAHAIVSERLTTLKRAREAAHEFIKLLEMDRAPVCEKNEPPILESDIQQKLNNYSMLTHGFGTPAVMVGMQTFYAFLNSQIDTLSSMNR